MKQFLLFIYFFHMKLSFVLTYEAAVLREGDSISGSACPCTAQEYYKEFMAFVQNLHLKLNKWQWYRTQTSILT